jgi:glycosyltransferase involved in cell wall biosynthesis
MNKLRPRIAIIHTGYQWLGGAEAVAVWTIEALRDFYDVTVFTISPMVIDHINRFYGTTFAPKDLQIEEIPLPKILKNNPGRFWHLKRHWAMRYCRSIANRFDLCISTYYEMDFGRRGIQYVHSPGFAAGMFDKLNQFINERQRSTFKKLYRRLSAIVSGFSIERVKQNITLVNSNWTGRIIGGAYGIEPITVYPPIPEDLPSIPWDEKENGFVCIGRLAPAKRVDIIIEVLKTVRNKGWDIHLHIIAGEVRDKKYYEKIREMQKQNSSWIFLEGHLKRKQLVHLIARHKYGIHGMRNEHFGIAVAEMVKAGNIVFVPNDGGQVEIVDSEHLTYETEEEATEKIVRVLSDGNLQTSLRAHLAKRAKIFSITRFMQEMRGIVREAL